MPAKQKPSKYAAGVNAAIFKALADPLRGRIFVLLHDRVASPREIADLFEEKLDNVAYHVRGLLKADLIELVATDRRKGGEQHFYKAVARPLLDDEAWEKIPKVVRETGTASVGQIIIGDMTEAVLAGTFDRDTARTMARTPLVLDQQGIEETVQPGLDLLERLSGIQARAAARMAEDGTRGINVMSTILIFRMPG